MKNLIQLIFWALSMQLPILAIKTLTVASVFLIVPSQLLAQVDHTKFLDSVIYEIERPYRRAMDKRDSILMKQIINKMDTIKGSEKYKFLDSLMSIIINVNTSMVLAQPLADMIASVNGEGSILLLLNNINTHKTRADAYEGESPCFIALKKYSSQMEVSRIILESNFLDGFRPVLGAFYSSDHYIVSFFRGLPNADASIREAIQKTTNVNKIEMLDFILAQLK